MNRVLVVTQYIYPETFKSTDIVFELSKRGYKVDVLTGIPNYPEGVYYKGYGLFRKRIETINGVRFYRCFQSPRGRRVGAIGLAFNYLTFLISACFWVLFFFAWKKSYDAIITHEPSPITQIIPAILLSKLRGTRVYSWIMDIWPDSMVRSVSPRMSRLMIPPLNAITDFVYRSSHKILITSKGMADLINRNADYSDKIIYFPNWSAEMRTSQLMKVGDVVAGVELPVLPEGFKIVMTGNLGTAQNLDAVAECMLLLKDIPEVKWVFVGNGSEKPWLDKFIEDNDLKQTAFALGRFPFDAMPYFCQNANALLLTLRAGRIHLDVTVPARLQSYMSAGRPVLAMVGSGATGLIEESNCGYAVAPGDYNALADVICNKVLNDKSGFEKKGENGRAFFEKEFEINKCIDNLERIISC